MTGAWQILSQGYKALDIVNDIVIYYSNVSEHIAHVRQFLQRCTDMNIALNIDKCKFAQPRLCLLAFSCQLKDTKLINQLQRHLSVSYTNKSY